MAPPCPTPDHGYAGATLPLPRGRARAWVLLREGSAGSVLLAVGVGVGAGAGAIVFRWLVTTATRLFSGHADYAAAGHAANPHLPWLGRWFVLLAPVVGGVLYGPSCTRSPGRPAGTASPR